MQFSLRSECIIPVAEVEALHCVCEAWLLSAQILCRAAVSIAVRPAAATGTELAPFLWERGLKKNSNENVAL